MKRVIDGKVYNTQTAQLIDEVAASCPCTDFAYWEESLYKTKKGRFFVAGEGGPMSRWSQAIDSNSWSGGAGMKVLTESEALEWCEENGIDADIIAEHFEVEEG